MSFSVLSSPLAPYWFDAPAMAFLRPPRCSRRGSVSRCYSLRLTLLLFVRVQSLSRAFLSRSSFSLLLAVARSSAYSTGFRAGPSMKFPTFWRHQMREATYTGFTSPSCAAPSDFLSLSTRYSALILSALFHADATQVSIFRGFLPRDSLLRLTTPPAPLAVSPAWSHNLTVAAPGIDALAWSVPSRPVLPGRCRPFLS